MSQHQLPPFFHEIFHPSLPRLGPGEESATIQALQMLLKALPGSREGTDTRPLNILDLGCGNGPQTIQLARQVKGTITAVDNHQPFLDELQRRAGAAGLADRIRTSRQDMGELRPDQGPFDLIWSEGAISIISFRQGLTAWRPLLAPGGGLAVTELCWLRPNPPEPCRAYLTAAYPDITDIAASLAAIESCGYESLGHFILPESAWWDAFYHPLEARLGLLRPQHAADPEAMGLIEAIQAEIEMYRQYSSYYGYVFYVMRRR